MWAKAQKYWRYLKRLGINWIAAIGAPGQGILAWSYTSDGTPDAQVFAIIQVNGETLPDMADTNYQVIVQGETAARTTVDESSKATTGFTIVGAANAEVVHVLVIGRLA